MSDLISRAEAIEALKEVSEHYTENGRQWHPHVDFMVQAIQDLPSAQQWIPLRFESEGDTNFPHKLDGHWVIVTDGETISVERIKKDAYDHFFPNGRWFGLEDVKAWMPLPEPYKKLFQPFR